MKWVDYREKLGIGTNDKKKYEMLKNRVHTFLNEQGDTYSRNAYRDYILMVGEMRQLYPFPLDSVYASLAASMTMEEFICKYIAFYNTYKADEMLGSTEARVLKDSIIAFLKNSLNLLNIQYDVILDDDGIFVFPKGVPEFDDALVSAPLDWLKDYPRTEKAWSKALRAYSEVTPKTASDVADLFRKSLETFFQEFFNTGDGRTLENCKSDYGKYLKDNGVPGEVSNNLETLLQAYTNYMSNYAKHTDKAKVNVQEYLMYQTGNIIRLVISLKQEESV